MLNPLSTSLNPLSSDSELSGFKIRNTLTFYLGGTQWSPRRLDAQKAGVAERWENKPRIEI